MGDRLNANVYTVSASAANKILKLKFLHSYVGKGTILARLFHCKYILDKADKFFH